VNAISYRYIPDGAEHAAFARYRMRHNPAYLLLLAGTVLAFLAGCGLLALVAGGASIGVSGEVAVFLPVFSFVMGVMLILQYVVSPLSTANVRLGIDPLARSEVSGVVDAQGVQFQFALGTGREGWGLYEGLVDLGNCFILVYRGQPDLGRCFPKRAFATPADAEAFRALATRAIPANRLPN